MASYKQYETKQGKKLWKFDIYLGTDLQTGKPKHTVRRGFNTKKEASLAASRLELEASRGAIVKDNNISFQTVYEQWYQAYVNTVGESTWNRTAGMFDNHILPALGKYRIRTITIAQIQRAVNDWFKIAARNYKRWYNYVVDVFEFAIKHGYLEKNVAKLITVPKKRESAGDKFENFWDKDQLAEFFSYLDPTLEMEKYTLFRVYAFCGVRRGEALALTWNDISFKDSTMRINKTLTQGEKGRQIIQAPKTRNSRRTIDLDPKTLNDLKEWKTIQKRKYLMLGFNTLQPNQLIFANNKNGYKSLNTPAKWLKSIRVAHNLTKVTVHGFRHSHCSALFSAGATIKEVQMRLGHADVATTLNIYTHVTKNQNKEVANKLAHYLDF
ncbi:tyrosine-type recombinase/integrase [Lapidilactobacillus mulanensis]|uniref:Integrase family protein n=2 Tax=Lapidilactobacillus TaxID=2767884 RepID=A0A0R1W3P7_9LACO|nr:MULTISPECIES: site-specific integrase [Lapidilactobacillus]KRM09926.1 integrase family protein [Lapidilactobacillus concavus DSM 17758]GEL14042.1 site-specific integrase [Lapidilactobacillus concavus]